MASHGVHAGPRGGYFDIGLHPDLDAIPAGPSHFGLSDPGGSSLVSLSQVTIVLLNHGLEMGTSSGSESGPDEFGTALTLRLLTIAKMRSLLMLADEGAAAFAQAHATLEGNMPTITEAPRIFDGSAE